MSNQQRPLVVFPGALGDFVCFVPALRAIAARTRDAARLLCKADLAPLVQAAGLGEPSAIEGRESSWLFQRDPPPEAARFFGSFAAVECFTGANSEDVHRNLAAWCAGRARVHSFRPRPGIHLARHFLRAITGSDAVPPPRLELDPAAAAAAHGRLESRLVRRPSLVIHPGSGGRAKRWSRAGFLEIAERARLRGERTLVVLGPAESVEERALWTAARVPVVDGLDLVEVAAVLSATRLYLGNDSGISHLAAAMGARGFALFGPTDAETWGPVSENLVAWKLDSWSAVDAPAGRVVVDAIDRALAAASAEVP